MKKALFLALSLAFLLTACGETMLPDTSEQNPVDNTQETSLPESCLLYYDLGNVSILAEDKSLPLAQNAGDGYATSYSVWYDGEYQDLALQDGDSGISVADMTGGSAVKPAALFSAVELALLFKQGAAALGAALGHRLVPCHIIALGVVAAAVVDAALAAFAHQHVATVQRAESARILDERVGVAALREAGAGHKLAVAARLDDHGPPALFADLIGRDVLDLDALNKVMFDFWMFH